MASNNPRSLVEQAQQEEKMRRNMNRGARRDQLGTAKKQLKRNLKPKAAPRKHWTLDELVEQDELGSVSYERIMPRDESERRRTLEQAAFRATSAGTPTATEQPAAPDGPQGIVIEVSAGLCRVDLDGRTLLCRVRGALTAVESAFTNVVAVGDRVVVTEDGDEGGIVEYVLPRRSVLARPDVFRSHLRQLIVANADQLLIVASWRDPEIWLELVDRYLIAAERSGLAPIICVNKADLIDDAAACQATLEPYRRIGYEVLLASAHTGAGIEALRGLLAGRMTVLAGLSGVGKSSLVAAVQPGLHLRTGAVSSLGEGKHTTTQATLLQLEFGGAVVDTPGIREFGLSGIERSELIDWLPEFVPFAGSCRFSNCVHLDEPGCAIRDAVGAGAIAKSRYHSYRRILDSLPAEGA